jgi:hypothetical protein
MPGHKVWAWCTGALVAALIILMVIVFAPESVAKTFPSLEVGAPHYNSQSYWIGVMVGIVCMAIPMGCNHWHQIKKNESTIAPELVGADA